ncbi:Putative ribonuclease H protein At1g65750 [Linum perenne]
MGMSPPRADGGEDKWVWGGEDNGCFTIKSAYRILNSGNLSSDPEPWRVVWNWKGQHRVRMFLWLAIQDTILTNKNRVRRHIATDASCGLCGQQEESTTHVLRDCVFAAESWRRLGGFDTTSSQWNSNLGIWMKKHLQVGDKSLLFGVHCWSLWKSRNERVFSGTLTSPVSVAHRSAIWTDQVSTSMGVKSAQITSVVDRRLVNVKWSPGQMEWHTLNVDGSVERQSGRAAAGGLLRDWDLRIEHIYREGNGAADFLAGIGYGYPFGSHTFDCSDSSLGYFLRYDCFGMTLPRLISIND